jgi:hypothetical protein
MGTFRSARGTRRLGRRRWAGRPAPTWGWRYRGRRRGRPQDITKDVEAPHRVATAHRRVGEDRAVACLSVRFSGTHRLAAAHHRQLRVDHRGVGRTPSDQGCRGAPPLVRGAAPARTLGAVGTADPARHARATRPPVPCSSGPRHRRRGAASHDRMIHEPLVHARSRVSCSPTRAARVAAPPTSDPDSPGGAGAEDRRSGP